MRLGHFLRLRDSVAIDARHQDDPLHSSGSRCVHCHAHHLRVKLELGVCYAHRVDDGIHAARRLQSAPGIRQVGGDHFRIGHLSECRSELAGRAPHGAERHAAAVQFHPHIATDRSGCAKNRYFIHDCYNSRIYGGDAGYACDQAGRIHAACHCRD